MALYRDHAVVLRTWKLGEADRIVSMLTQHQGKVRGVAKGVRRTKSRFGGRLEPTSHVAVQLYRGRGDLDTITQVETVDRYDGLRADLDVFGRASAMLEAVEQIAQDRHPNPSLYTMLVRALRTLDGDPSPLVVAAFFWKLLALEGFEPQLDVCVACGKADDLVAFSLEDGGTLCGDCRRGAALGADTLELLRMILGGQLGEALRQPPSGASHAVDALATSAMEHHLERRIRSLGVLGGRH